MTSTELAKALIDAADDGGVIQAADMLRLTTEPTLHTACRLRTAAHALDVAVEVAELLSFDDDEF